MPPTAFEIPVPDWQTFAQLVAEHGDGSWIFRGVTREEHQLVPAIGRLRKDGLGDTGRHYTPDAEIKCLAMFKRAARPFLPFVPDTELEWLTIAQHYGLRTRLLDWTESPLVAAFFATEAPDRNGAPAIYCSKAPPDATPAEQADPLHAMRDVKTFRAPHLNTRIQVQRSIVTVHPRP